MNHEEINEYANKITTIDEFSIFIENLIKNHKQQGDDWENDNIEKYLNGVLAFMHNIDGYYEFRGEDVDLERPTWRIVARIFLAARIFG